MKDYKKMFEEANKEAIEQFEKKIEKQGKKSLYLSIIIMIFTLLFAFAVMVIGLLLGGEKTVMEAIKTVLSNTFPLIAIIICAVLLMFLVNAAICSMKRASTENPLEEKAVEFATTIYFDDLISALASVFTLSDEFTKKLKEIISNYEWLEEGTFDFDPDGMDLNYENDRKVLLHIEHEGYIYYLAAWKYYPNFPFTFVFDKVPDKGGIVEQGIKMRLPIIT
jgi:magnesium-transporting ATPase (P-type)